MSPILISLLVVYVLLNLFIVYLWRDNLLEMVIFLAIFNGMVWIIWSGTLDRLLRIDG